MRERENFKFSEFSSFIQNSETRKIEELESHLKEIDKTNITFSEKLKIGDEVELKGVDYTVIIEHIDFEIAEMGRVDYAGRKKGDNSKSLKLFNQKDIKGKVNEIDDREER